MTCADLIIKTQVIGINNSFKIMKNNYEKEQRDRNNCTYVQCSYVENYKTKLKYTCKLN